VFECQRKPIVDKVHCAMDNQRWMTDEEIEREYRYRYHERLGFLVGDGEANAAAKRIARAEADKWKAAAIASVSKERGE
jgi:hypothetical protein